MKISEGCQYVNKGQDGICYWWQKTYLGSPGYEWGCFSPHKMEYLTYSKFKYMINDEVVVCPEPFMDCPLQEIWFWEISPKFKMCHVCECGSNEFYHPNKIQTRFKCWKCGVVYV
jgi:hypothetical protein